MFQKLKEPAQVTGEKLLRQTSKVIGRDSAGRAWQRAQYQTNHSYSSDAVHNEALWAQDDRVTEHNLHQGNNVSLGFMCLK